MVDATPDDMAAEPTKGHRAPDPAIEAAKVARAIPFVREQLANMGQTADDAAIEAIARKVAKGMPPYAFHGKYMS
jgi:hypothetical protein